MSRCGPCWNKALFYLTTLHFSERLEDSKSDLDVPRQAPGTDRFNKVRGGVGTRGRRSEGASISGAFPVGRAPCFPDQRVQNVRPRPTILAPDMETGLDVPFIVHAISTAESSRVFRQSHLYKSSRASAMSSTAAAPASASSSLPPRAFTPPQSP